MRKFIHLFSILLVAALLAAVNTGCSARPRRLIIWSGRTGISTPGNMIRRRSSISMCSATTVRTFRRFSRLADIYFEEGRLRHAAPFIFKGHQMATNDLEFEFQTGGGLSRVGKIKRSAGRSQISSWIGTRRMIMRRFCWRNSADDAGGNRRSEQQRLQMLSQKSDGAVLQVALGHHCHPPAGDFPKSGGGRHQTRAKRSTSKIKRRLVGPWGFVFGQSNLTEA